MRNIIVFAYFLIVNLPLQQSCKSLKTPVTPPVQPAPAADTMAAAPASPAGKTDPFLAELLRKNGQLFDTITSQLNEYQVQIIYTQVNRDKNNTPSFTDHFYNVDDRHYFYPASVVKMPIAFLALQKINELKQKGIAIDMNTAMITETARESQTPVYNDPTTAAGQPSVAQYIRKIFLVSDNDAFNRLYEFLGAEYIYEHLNKMGFKSAEIIHRLSILLSAEENRHTNPIKFYNAAGELVYEQPAQYFSKKLPVRNDQRGLGYMSGGKLVKGPFDFSKKNRLSLEDMHGIMRSVIFPQQVSEKKRFNLTEEDYTFLRKCMSQFPRESVSPSYPGIADNYLKFNLTGGEPKTFPPGLRIFNKSGEAYGYLTDITYIADFENNIEFMLSATIHVNKDGIFNDDKYEYKTTGLPFLNNLGKVIYDHEKARKRNSKPDLSAFKFAYGD